MITHRTFAALYVALCSCASVVVYPPNDSHDESTSSGSPSDDASSSSGEADSSGSGESTGSTGDESTDSGSSSSDGASSTGEEPCTPQPRPYGECDLSCGALACDGGRTCVGDPTTGEASCADPCEAADTCPSDVFPAPWSIPVCQPAALFEGSWCAIPCLAGTCPNITVCTDLGGQTPVCVGGQ